MVFLVISGYINAVTLCPCYEPLVAQVAENPGCSDTFCWVEYFVTYKLFS